MVEFVQNMLDSFKYFPGRGLSGEIGAVFPRGIDDGLKLLGHVDCLLKLMDC
jgi:hypothetical protein